MGVAAAAPPLEEACSTFHLDLQPKLKWSGAVLTMPRLLQMQLRLHWCAALALRHCPERPSRCTIFP